MVPHVELDIHRCLSSGDLSSMPLVIHVHNITIGNGKWALGTPAFHNILLTTMASLTVTMESARAIATLQTSFNQLFAQH